MNVMLRNTASPPRSLRVRAVLPVDPGMELDGSRRVISKIRALGASPSSSEPFGKLLIGLGKAPLAVSSALVVLRCLVTCCANVT